MTWKQWVALAILLFITMLFAGGGVIIGAWLKYLTTGIWLF